MRMVRAGSASNKSVQHDVIMHALESQLHHPMKSSMDDV